MLRFGSKKLVNCLRVIGDGDGKRSKRNRGDDEGGEDLLVDWPSSPFSTTTKDEALVSQQPTTKLEDSVVSAMSAKSHERNLLLARLTSERHLQVLSGGGSSSRLGEQEG